jgi:hypothetical protein
MSKSSIGPLPPALRGALVGVVLAGGLSLAACASTATPSASGSAVPATVPDTNPAVPLNVPTAPTVEITARDYSYEGLPDHVAVGSELTLKNASQKEVHEIVVFRLPDTERRTGAELMRLSEADFDHAVPGGPTTVLFAAPASAGTVAVGDGVVGKPGRYLAFCAVPMGADPTAYMAAAAKNKGGAVKVPGGPPHLMAGMYREFTAS